MVPQTSMTMMQAQTMDGFTPHGPTTQQPTQVRFTSTVLLTGKVASVLLREAVLSSLVDVTAEKPVTEASLTRLLSGTLQLMASTSLSLPLARVHSTTTVTDYLTHGQLDLVSLTQTQTQTVTVLLTQTSSLSEPIQPKLILTVTELLTVTKLQVDLIQLMT